MHRRHEHLVVTAAVVLTIAVAWGTTVLQSPTSSFTGGELSPGLVSRGENPAYKNGCKELENTLVIDVGAATRRPGSVYVAEPNGTPARLEPFVYSETDSYAMVFSHETMMFLRDTGYILDPNDANNAYEIDTPWDGNDVFTLNFYQSKDVCYIVSNQGLYSPIRLTRYAHNNWTLTDCNTLILDGPFRDRNTDEISIYADGVTGHFGRLVFGGDLTLWWSAADDYENFYPGIYDDQAFTFTISLATHDPIKWLKGEKNDNLIVGTAGRIMEIRATDDLAGFTPSNPPMIASGSSVTVGAPAPAVTPTSLLFTDRTDRRVYELVYDDTGFAVQTPDLTILASHITGDTGVKQMAWQRSPYPTLWCVRNDGEMATLYYDRDYQVGAWSRQVTDGSYHSVACVPVSGSVDRVWAVVERTVDSNTVYYIEYFKDIELEADIEDVYYVDSGLSYDGGSASITAITKATPTAVTLSSWPTGLADGDNVYIESVSGMTEINQKVFEADDCNSTAYTLTLNHPTSATDWNSVDYTTYTSGGTLKVVDNTFAGLDHLEGESVAVVGDGGYLGTETVSSGTITLDDYYNVVHAGLPYTTTIIPTAVDAMGSGQSTQPFIKRITGLYLYVYYTVGGKFGPTESIYKEIPWPRQPWTATAPYQTGSIVLPPVGGGNRDSQYVLIQNEPMPFTLLTAIPIYEVGN